MSVISDDLTEAETSAFDVLFRNLMQFPIFPLENDDPTRLGLRLLGTDQTRAHDVVGLGIGAQFTGDEAEGVFLLHELMSVENLIKKIVKLKFSRFFFVFCEKYEIYNFVILSPNSRNYNF